MRTFLLITFLFHSLSLFCQDFSLQTKEIEVLVEYEKLNDTTLYLKYTIKNKSFHNIYVYNVSREAFYYYDQLYSLPSNILQISLGDYCIASSMYSTFVAKLKYLESANSFNNDLYIYCHDLNQKNKVIISFDYIDPLMYPGKIRKEISNSLAKDTSASQFFLSSEIYTKYYEYFSFTLPLY